MRRRLRNNMLATELWIHQILLCPHLMARRTTQNWATTSKEVNRQGFIKNHCQSTFQQIHARMIKTQIFRHLIHKRQRSILNNKKPNYKTSLMTIEQISTKYLRCQRHLCLMNFSWISIQLSLQIHDFTMAENSIWKTKDICAHSIYVLQLVNIGSLHL